MLKSIQKLLLIGFSYFGLFLTDIAYAQSNSIPEADMVQYHSQSYEAVNSMFSYGIATLIIFAVIGLLFTAFWVWMLIHAITNPIEKKALWVIILLLLGVLGAIIYYFAVKRSFDSLNPAMPNNASPTPIPPANPQ